MHLSQKHKSQWTTFIVLWIFICSFNIFANTEQSNKIWGTVTGSRVNVRTGPSIQSKKITIVTKGTKLQLIGKKENWLKIIIPHKISLWVPKEDVQILPNGKMVSIISDQAQLRLQPNPHSEVLATLSKGTKIHRVSEVYNWVEIQTSKKITAWISGQYVTTKQSDSKKKNLDNYSHQENNDTEISPQELERLKNSEKVLQLLASYDPQEISSLQRYYEKNKSSRNEAAQKFLNFIQSGNRWQKLEIPTIEQFCSFDKDHRSAVLKEVKSFCDAEENTGVWKELANTHRMLYQLLFSCTSTPEWAQTQKPASFTTLVDKIAKKTTKETIPEVAKEVLQDWSKGESVYESFESTGVLSQSKDNTDLYSLTRAGRLLCYIIPQKNEKRDILLKRVKVNGIIVDKIEGTPVVKVSECTVLTWLDRNKQ